MGAIRVIGRSLRDIWDEMLLLGLMNIVTLLAQATIVLGPPAMAGLHAMCNRVANGFAISWDNYLQACRTYFVRSWIFAVPPILISALIVYNFLFYGTFAATWAVWVQGAWLAGLIFVTAIQFYMFPFLMEQDDKRWRMALRNSALVAGANPLYTVVLLVVALVLTGVFLLVLPLFVFFGLIPWVMFGNAAVVDRVAAFRKRADAAGQQ